MTEKYKNISIINNRELFDEVSAYTDALIDEATLNGALNNPETDNEYICEIGRLGRLCAEYENEHIRFKHIAIRKKSSPHRLIEYA